MDAVRRIVRDYQRGHITQAEFFCKLMGAVADGDAAAFVSSIPPSLLSEVETHVEGCPRAEEDWARLRWFAIGLPQSRCEEMTRLHRRGVEALRAYYARGRR